MLLRVLLVVVSFCVAVVSRAQFDPGDLINYCNNQVLGCEPGKPGFLYTWIETFRTGPPQFASSKINFVCRVMQCGFIPGGLGTADVDIPNDDMRSDHPNGDYQPPACGKGSIIGINNRTLGENIKIIGTDFDLVYSSSLVPGFKKPYRVVSKVIGSPIGSGSHITIKDETDAVVVSQGFVATANLNYTYNWDGLDASNNETWGSLKYKFTLSQGFSGYDLADITPIDMGTLKAKKLGIGAWIPSVWHFYDSSAEKIIYGDGSSRKVTGEALGGGGWRVAEVDASYVYEFDSVGKITRTLTGLTGQVIREFSYDGSGRLIEIEEAFSRTTTFTRNGSGVLQSITAPNGKVTTVTFDGNGYLASVTGPDSEVYEMTYGSTGLMATFEKPNGATSTFTYDADGNLSKDEHSGGYFTDIAETTTASFSPKLHTATSRMGRETLVENNLLNLEQTTTYPDGAQRKYKLDVNNIQTSEFGVDYVTYFGSHARFGDMSHQGASTTITGNPFTISKSYSDSVSLNTPGDPFSVNTWTHTDTLDTSTYSTVYTGSTKTFVTTSDVGRTRTREIDTYERTVSDQRGNLTPVEYTYTDDKLTQIAQGARETDLTYNSTSGLLETITNPLNQTTTFAYNSAERLTSVTLPDSRVIAYGYDDVGNLTSVTPDSQPLHDFDFNAEELLSAYNPPTLTGVTTVATTYGYNNDKQLTSINRPDGQTVTLTYHSTNGKLTSISDGTSTYTYAFGNNRLIDSVGSPGYNVQFSSQGNYITTEYTNVTVPSWSLIATYGRSFDSSRGYVSSDYVSAGSNSLTISYGYDDDHLLTTAGDETLTYNTPNGLLTGITHGADFDQTYGYNSFGEITDHEAIYDSTTLYDLAITRDDLGRVSTKTQVLDGTTDVYEYTYDSSGRLSQVEKNSSVVSTYTYDDNNNRTGGSVYGTSTAGTYDDQDRMTDYNVFDYTYNDNGDLLTKTNTLTSQVWTYAYDVFGNLKSVTLPNTDVISYETDGLHRRIARKLNGTLTHQYVYMDQLRLVGEIDVSSGDLVRRYIYGSKQNIPDYFIEGAEKYRIISDNLGSLRMVVKVSDGTIMQKMDHDEFGRVTVDTNSGYTPFGFAGGIYDPSTALVRFGARDYDSYSGRWTAKDSLRFRAGDTNLYGYVFSDPVNFVDRTGKFAVALIPFIPVIIDAAIATGAVAAAIGLYDAFMRRLPITGPPGESLDRKDKNGDKIQERFYDDEGNPLKDIDYGHDHGPGRPHVHDWIDSIRQPGRPPKPGECK